MITATALARSRDRAGITLTEILIAILILAVGLASLATLFPLGLLRLREAARSTRSAYLTESAAADMAARGLLTTASFNFADQFNLNNGLTPWWFNINNSPAQWSPLIADTASYGDYPTDPNNLGVTSANTGNYGLPFAYDPLWRYQTQNPNSLLGPNGYYLNDPGPNGTVALEARFGSGIGYIQNDPSDGGVPSAHGLQRLTNFNRPYAIVNGNTVPIMPVSTTVPNVFVSPEDVVWVENVANSPFSSVLPDLTLNPLDSNGYQTSTNDWRYSWMFTGQQNNGSSGSTFDGNIVIFENRPFGITDTSAIAPNAANIGGFQCYQVDGETVVEGIFGYSANIASASGNAPGFGVSADRAVLLRWYSSQPDPVVKVGDWIADVTYERTLNIVQNSNRYLNFPQYLGGTATGTVGGLQNPYNNFEWDNLPAQRCYWYRVQKVIAATDDSGLQGARSMVVYVDRSLAARTPLKAGGQPYSVNAALICPSVVNVIPQTFFTR